MTDRKKWRGEFSEDISEVKWGAGRVLLRIVLPVVVALVVIGAGSELLGLGWFRFIEPKRESVRREVFEETKSYVHGAIQDIARYHGEYAAATEEEQKAIKVVIRTRFAEFDADHIESTPLRTWFIDARGF